MAKSKASKLLAVCEKFIEDQNITFAETIYQTDRVIEGAYDFIYEICEIVGYAEIDEDD